MASNNANEPAFPETPLSGGKQGLTKREYFAGLAMQALISQGEYLLNAATMRRDLCADAVGYADALLAEAREGLKAALTLDDLYTIENMGSPHESDQATADISGVVKVIRATLAKLGA